MLASRPMKLPRAAALACSAALAPLATLWLLGCPPSLDDPERFQTSCPTGFSVDAMLRQQCSRVGCHVVGAAAAGGLDLTSADAFDRMYGKASLCGPPLISASGPDQSVLVAKLEGTASCGGRMPLGGTPLTASQIACVQAWITAGIAKAGPPPTDAGSDAPAVVDAGDAGDDGGDASDAGNDAADDAGDAGDGGLTDVGDAG